MAEKKTAYSNQERLAKFARKLSKVESLRNGSAIFHLTGDDAGEFCLQCLGGKASVADRMPVGTPVVEVWGDARRIGAILEGKKDARLQFLAGGIRVRGDLRYLSDVALELGIIEEPL